METWKRNLFVLCGALFIVMVGMSMVMPFLPLFIQEELHITNTHDATLWSGIIFGANFLTAGLVSPVWGNLADKYGRKIMILRSGFLMSITIGLTGLAGNVWHLLFLRLLNGTISGIIPASNALVASSVPQERSGWALGILQSCVVSGSIMGPFFGGLLADLVGYRAVFMVTGSLLFIATLIITFTVKEDFTPLSKTEQTSLREDFKMVFASKTLPVLFGVTVIVQFALNGIVPILPIFVKELIGSSERVAFFAGLVTAMTGIANVIASPQLGKLGDRIGSHKVLLGCLLASAIIYIPTAMVQTLWQLLILRFMAGLCVGGLLPAVNSLLRKATPSHMVSRVFGYNNSFLCLGNMLGPVTGGFLAGFVGLNGVFLMTSILLFLNFIWFLYAVRHGFEAVSSE
ncbi:MFS transporter [Brevibacillus laterosporus]|uniref:Metal-tetracycline/H(+) antiporter n=1 Tax=Brevibacillus laterosporus LMG 15441 TaxID=1042163 RepID=A0A075QXJ6_BRELA|nr:MFS transporter [Brevibacillus laterosporus]AIG25092.1 metal-tetracycline/H(+) antiporter [Brevibacillus laterosporus LMG 15441]RJL08244.1 MFS transporter [Brevibacillus laterosporus]TPH16234.1 MFS transporter [Brevibacillus laterosporus]HAS01897.1 MFS transporter [Brevibacillus sp.]